MSSQEDFIEQVQAQLPPGLQDMSSEIPKIVADLAETGLISYDYPRLDVKKVIQILPRLFVHNKGKDKSIVKEGKLSAHALLTADYLAESLMPRIRAIRKAYFGSEEAPFKSVEEAEQWASIYDSGAFFLEQEKAESWRSVFRDELASYEWEYIPGRGKDKVYFMTRAFWIWDDAQNEIFELSNRTGISPESLRSYVLADIKPLQAPYEISMPGQEFCRGKRKCWSVDIKVNTELGFEDLFEIHNIVKEALGTKKGKRLNEKHLELYTMVQERGGAPSGKGSVKFWQSLLQEWNDKYEGEYQEWRCIKRAYDRLHDRLNAQYETKEAQHEN